MSTRKMPVTKQIRSERRAQAEARQKEYDKLTLQQKIDRLPPKPFAAKQRTKLMGLLSGQKEKPEVSVKVELDQVDASSLSELGVKRFNKKFNKGK